RNQSSAPTLGSNNTTKTHTSLGNSRTYPASDPMVSNSTYSQKAKDATARRRARWTNETVQSGRGITRTVGGVFPGGRMDHGSPYAPGRLTGCGGTGGGRTAAIGPRAARVPNGVPDS